MASIDIARDVRPAGLQECLRVLPSFLNLSELELAIYFVHNIDMLVYNADEQLSPVMTGVADGTTEDDLDVYALSPCEALTSLIVDVVANETTVPLLRALLRRARLPVLRMLNVTIGILYDPERSRADWAPFGQESDGSSQTSRQPILSPDLAARIAVLGLAFEADCREIHVYDANTFYGLFGSGSRNSSFTVGTVMPTASVYEH
jgi:hypothetical protein